MAASFDDIMQEMFTQEQMVQMNSELTIDMYTRYLKCIIYLLVFINI